MMSDYRVAVFIDYQNTLHSLRRQGRQIDLPALREYLAEGRQATESFVYVATHPQLEHQADDQAYVQRLRQGGFLVRNKMGQLLPDGRLRCNFNNRVREVLARPTDDASTGDRGPRWNGVTAQR